jgi:hypothetical protein
MTVIPLGKALSRRKGVNGISTKLAAAGLTLIHEQLSDENIQHFDLAALCGDQRANDLNWLSCVGLHRDAAYVEGAKTFYRRALWKLGAAHGASIFLSGVRYPYEDDAITREHANAMLHFLFNSMGGKRHDKEVAMMKLAACSEIFSPASNTLGRALELWQPVPQHPVVLALAIKQLKASKVFEPEESELREALANVVGKVRKLERGVDQWIERMCDSDPMMFKIDRDGWQAAHAGTDADSVCVLCMYHDEHKCAADYRDALEVVWEEKFDRENPGERERDAAIDAARQAEAEAEAKKK